MYFVRVYVEIRTFCLMAIIYNITYAYLNYIIYYYKNSAKPVNGTRRVSFKR